MAIIIYQAYAQDESSISQQAKSSFEKIFNLNLADNETETRSKSENHPTTTNQIISIRHNGTFDD